MNGMKFEVLGISGPQIEALVNCARLQLSRGPMGWGCDTGVGPVQIHSPATIKSLWKRGLLDANFNDPRGVGPFREARRVENLDGLRYPHSPEVSVLLVWTSELGRNALDDIQQKLLEDIGRIVGGDIGRQVLEDEGLLPDQSEIVYH